MDEFQIIKTKCKELKKLSKKFAKKNSEFVTEFINLDIENIANEINDANIKREMKLKGN